MPATPTTPASPQPEIAAVKFSDSPARIKGLVRQADGSTLVLREVAGVNPNRIVVSKVDANGTFAGDIEIASKPVAIAELARQSLYDASIAADGLGNAFVGWFDYIPNASNSNEPRRLHVRRIAQGVPRDETLFSATGSGMLYSHQLVAAQDGSALLVWTEAPVANPATGISLPPSVYVASYSTAGGWGPASKLGQADGLFLPQVWMATRDGKAVVAYVSGAYLVAVSRDANGEWSMPTQIRSLADGVQQFDRIQAAIDGAGNIMVMWRARLSSVQEIGYNRFDAALGRWLGADYVVRESSDDQTPTLVMNSAGAGMLAWREGGYAVVAHFDRAGWTARHILSTQDPNWTFGAFPFVAIAEDGSGIATWNQAYIGPSVLPQHYALRVSRYTPATGWSPAKALGTPDAVQLNLGISNVVAGKVLAVWAQGDLGSNRETYWASQLDLASPAMATPQGLNANPESMVTQRQWAHPN